MTSETWEIVKGSIRGALDVEDTEAGVMPRRLPGWALAQTDFQGLHWAAEQGSGVRLAFQSSATWLEVDVETTSLALPGADPATLVAPFAVTIDGRAVLVSRVTGGNYRRIQAPGIATFVQGHAATVRFDLGSAAVGERAVTLWLPHNAAVAIRELRSDSPLVPAPPPEQRHWLHYGSSISHCAEAESPLGVWPVAAARELGLDVTNLGLAANAQLDPFAARVIRDSPAELISLKVGINIVNGGTMKRRTFVPAVHGFLDTIREGKPSTPVLVISPIFCPLHEDTPGPIASGPPAGGRGEQPAGFDPAGALSLRIVRDLLAGVVTARAATDPSIYYLDGLELFGENDVHDLPDLLHPNAAGYLRMAERFQASQTVKNWLASGSQGITNAN